MAKKFAVFDVDGTVIRWQLYHGIGDAMAKAKIISPADFEVVREARMHWKKRGDVNAFRDYEKKLVVAFDKGLSGLAVQDFDLLVDNVFEEYKEQVYTFTRKLITDLKSSGYKLFAISGSPDAIVKKIVEHYGFDDYAATLYPTEGKKFTGEKILSLGKKSELLKSLAKKHRVSWHDSVGVGDTESDIDILRLVENPIAFNPSKLLFEEAVKNLWEIVVERKNMVYVLEAKDGSYILAKTNH